MDIEFHYHINYLIGSYVGFSPEFTHKVAYSAQYVDDNMEQYSIFSNGVEKKSIVTQTMNPMISLRDAITIFPIFHFIPGNDIISTLDMRRDGECRHMTTTPNNKLARKVLIAALRSGDPYWIGIASHSFVDTWAHQNFTGLKDRYNCIHATNTLAIPYIGHVDALHLPDMVNQTWYDYRLKEMKIDNNERFLDAAVALLTIYEKYGKELIEKKFNKIKKPQVTLRKTLLSIFKGKTEDIDLAALCDGRAKYVLGSDIKFEKSNKLIRKILGINKNQRIDIYMKISQYIEKSLWGKDYVKQYEKNEWKKTVASLANDNKKWNGLYDTTVDTTEMALGDSANDMNCLWNRANYSKEADLCNFQKAAEKQVNFLFDRVIKIIKKDIFMIRKFNHKDNYVEELISFIE